MKTTIATMFLTLATLYGSIALGADKPKPAAASPLTHVATCRDGKEYYAPTNDHRGACSGHGGVVAWSDGSPVRAKGAKGDRYRFESRIADDCDTY